MVQSGLFRFVKPLRAKHEAGQSELSAMIIGRSWAPICLSVMMLFPLSTVMEVTS